MKMVAGKESYLATFEGFEKKVSAKDPAWIRSLRKGAIERFASLGFPTAKDEEWKYTRVEPIVNTPFQFALNPSDGVTLEKINAFSFGALQWPRLVFVNGFYSAKLSELSELSGKIKVSSLREAFLKEPERVEAHFGRYVNLEKNAFGALNTAFVQDGALIDLGRGEVVDEPIHLVFISVSPGGTVLSQPRNLMVAGAGSSATVIESYVSLAAECYFTNAVTEIVLEEGARLDHNKLLRESENAFHIGTTHVCGKKGSFLSSSSVAWSGRIAKNQLRVLFDAEEGECVLNGLYVVSTGQHVDNSILIDHAKPRCTSNELYKGIVNGRGTAVFNGKIIVREDAQKTSAHQVNKNLLLSEEANVDTKPHLEIFADDVKCTHGAAVGQLDEEAIFYLKSRGLSEKSARNILTYGFASDVIQRIKVEPVRKEFVHLLAERLQIEAAEVAE
jgi:Fe-S cluster assembly protein SufD